MKSRALIILAILISGATIFAQKNFNISIQVGGGASTLYNQYSERADNLDMKGGSVFMQGINYETGDFGLFSFEGSVSYMSSLFFGKGKEPIEFSKLKFRLSTFSIPLYFRVRPVEKFLVKVGVGLHVPVEDEKYHFNVGSGTWDGVRIPNSFVQYGMEPRGPFYTLNAGLQYALNKQFDLVFETTVSRTLDLEIEANSELFYYQMALDSYRGTPLLFSLSVRYKFLNSLKMPL